MSQPRVLLVNNNNLNPPVAPIALDYLAAALEENGIEPVIVDLVRSEQPPESLAGFIRNNEFTLAALTIRNIDDSSGDTRESFLPHARDTVNWLKENCSCPVVIGGCGFSILPVDVLGYTGADFGIKGDGEEALVELAFCLCNGTSYLEVPGLLYREEGGGIQYNSPVYCRLERMDYLSRRSFVDNNWYYMHGGQGNVETKRGCEQGCIYCSDPISRGKMIRLRPAVSVVREIANLVEQGINCFHFCDAEFNLPPGHAQSVCQEIIKCGLNEVISWYVYCSPVPFSEQLARLMKEAGCVGINFGIDSGSDPILAGLGRIHKKSDLIKMARSCHRNDIIFMTDLLLGGPGEMRETVKETILLVKELDPFAAGISLGVRVYKETPIYRELLQKGLHNCGSVLSGEIEGNENFLFPVYYRSEKMGEDIRGYIDELTSGDPRFLSFAAASPELDYNYTNNDVLKEAIKRGYRGAYWYILRKFPFEVAL